MNSKEATDFRIWQQITDMYSEEERYNNVVQKGGGFRLPSFSNLK